MKSSIRSNRGVTLIELIASIAILSIVGFAAFTLLMFSIRTNNFIVTGSTASKDAQQLNDRLEILFDDVIDIAKSTETDGTYLLSFNPALEGDEPTTAALSFDGTTLIYDDLVYCEEISDFRLESIPDTSLIRVTYSIGSREFVKLFRLRRAPMSYS